MDRAARAGTLPMSLFPKRLRRVSGTYLQIPIARLLTLENIFLGGHGQDLTACATAMMPR